MSGFNNRPPVGQQLVDNAASNVAGILSTRPSARYTSGARTILKVNNKICGFAFGISWNITTAVTDIMTLDDYLPYEMAPQRIMVTGTISALHIPGTSAGTELWQGDVLAFLFHRYITIEVRDVNTDDILFLTTKAVITSRSEDLKVDQLGSVQLSFKAIGYRDEKDPDPNIATDSGAANPLVKALNKLPF